MLLEGSSLTPGHVKELIIVPDGVTWYVPFEALVATVRTAERRRSSKSPRVRYAPTVGLAFSSSCAWRRIQRTGVVLGKMVPGEKPEEPRRIGRVADGCRAIALPARHAVRGAVARDGIAAGRAGRCSTMSTPAAPIRFAWSPLPIDRAAQAGTLDQWLALPGDGPQRILLPGMHTLAERGGKAARNRDAGPPEVICSTPVAASCRQAPKRRCLSRWRVGGQSTLDLMREFIQELPHTAADEAWQRSVQLTMEAPIDAALEKRVKATKNGAPLTGKHPFFWAGYLVVDTGWRPDDDAPTGGPAAPVLNLPGAAAPGPAAPPAQGGAPADGVPPAPMPPTDVPPVPTPPTTNAPTPSSATTPSTESTPNSAK